MGSYLVRSSGEQNLGMKCRCRDGAWLGGVGPPTSRKDRHDSPDAVEL